MKNFIFLVVLFGCFAVQAQKNNIKQKPTSIYTFSPTFNNNDLSLINKRLQINNFSFVFVNEDDIDNGNFTLPFDNFGKKPSKFIYDDYNNYRDNNHLKGFLRKHDLTRWHPNELKLQ